MKLSRTKLLLLNFLFWALLVLINVLQYLVLFASADTEFEWKHYFARFFSVYFGYFLLSVPLYLFVKRVWEYRKLARIFLILVFGVFFSFLHVCIRFLILLLFRPELKGDNGPIAYIGNELFYNYGLAIGSYLFYVLMVGMVIGVKLYQEYQAEKKRASQLAHQLSMAQLNALKMQFQPHFLFNTLNTISMMAYQQKNEDVVEMISSMAELLRGTMQMDRQQKVALETELGLLKKYIAIEEIRFQDRFRMSYRIDERLWKAAVPGFITQPIVENAFKHGVSKSMGTSDIAILIGEEKGRVCIRIRNTGPELKEGFDLEKDMGVGLSNTKERLQGLYSSNFLFLIRNRTKGDGVEVKLMFPLEFE